MARTKTLSILNSLLAEIAGNAVAQQRRSHSMSRDVLYVATSSSTWAQDMKFKRRSILKKLNARLSSPLVDIQFSTTQWQKDAAMGNDLSQPSSGVWQKHPSHVVEAAPSSPSGQITHL